MEDRKNKYFYLSVLAAITFFISSCGKMPDLEVEKQKLMILHKEQKDAHLHKNAKQFVNLLANNMISINHGKISTTTRDSLLLRFQSYFDKVQIQEWKDVSPPVIDFSVDATMAYMVIDKLIVVTYINEHNELIEESTHFAWVSIFKKQEDGDWKIVCNVSTNEPERRS